MSIRQGIIAEYTTYSTFVVPEGIDLHETKWYVRYNTLYIEFKDGRILTVDPYISADESDLKDVADVTKEEVEVDEDYKDEDYVSEK